MTVRITESELLDALAAATPGNGPDDARTLAELRTDTGFSRERLLASLHVCRRAGRLVVHQVYRETLLGRRTRVPAYTITPSRPTKKRK